jgi:redox-sensitive bicupin YhaK (pirin superfamily)
MSAGSGIRHSEYNHAQKEQTHFLQIWIEPNVRGIAPGYEEKRFEAAEKRGRLRLVASPDGADGSVLIHQDARLYVGLFNGAEAATLNMAPGRRAYVHVARGSVSVNGVALEAGDALKVSEEAAVALADGRDAEVLVFDLG